ncbi:MAG: pentapeptide repeat-containing protein, partial [Candidatus Thermoplasmatota archaeon]|nr:pentapeptide repeat-containing protein [Candidatus Thermoplasmatota archaeon]
NLQEAILQEAKMQGAYLNEANMRGIKLHRAEMQGASLNEAKMQGANLNEANMQGVKLHRAELIGADLSEAKLHGAILSEAKLQKSNLKRAELIGADLSEAQLQGVDLSEAQLNRAKLKITVFDSSSRLDRAILVDSNLHLSYIDYAKSFRNAHMFGYDEFEEEDLKKKDINERIADSFISFPFYTLKSDLRLDLDEIEKAEMLDNDLRELLTSFRKKSGTLGPNHFVFYKEILQFIAEQYKDRNAKEAANIQNKIKKIVFKGSLLSNFFSCNPLFKKSTRFVLAPSKNKYIAKKIDRTQYYDASKEVYNKLYHFYANEGMKGRLKHVHYRRAEVERKHLLVRHKWYTYNGFKDRLQAYFFNLPLKMLAGYGNSILRPIISSIFVIFFFGLLFRLLEGVKIEGRGVNLFDYLFLSVSAFTGLGFTDVQPLDTWIMQVLIMLESIIGITMVALIIFVITYQIAR